jgi:hypothetical protein
VEPKYEKQLQTLDELLDSDVVYGYHPFISSFQDTFGNEFVKFSEHKKLQEDCSDIRKCVERMITQRDLACTTSLMFATYVAREMGTGDVGKVICSLDGVIISAGATILFKKGNPLLDRFNILMRRYLEAGLLERHWTELQHRANLRGGSSFREATGDVVFAFSLSHLMPAFSLLLVGTILSSLFFIAELILNCLWIGGKIFRTVGNISIIAHNTVVD